MGLLLHVIELPQLCKKKLDEDWPASFVRHSASTGPSRGSP